MYGRLTMVCGSVRSRLKEIEALYVLVPNKSFRFADVVSDVGIFGVIYLLIGRTAVLVVMVP